MGADSDIGELLAKAAAELADAKRTIRDEKRGSVWKPVAAALLTLVGSVAGGALATGRYLQRAESLLDAHERAIVTLQDHDDRTRNHLTETWDVAIAAKSEAERQRDRLDAHLNVRTDR